MKIRLWQRFGDTRFPAEWDGKVYGGGKISQRFWEYLKTIEYLDLPPGARVLDIGGGSPTTGVSFFPQLIASFPELHVGVLDTQFGNTADLPKNIALMNGLANRQVLADAIRSYKPTHISCISVMEHARPSEQRGVFEALEAEFHGTAIAMTVEFHEHIVFTTGQDRDDGHRFTVTTTASLSAMVAPLTRYFLDDVASAPIHAVNAFQELSELWRPLAIRFLKA
jgi:hypothetical protein